MKQAALLGILDVQSPPHLSRALERCAAEKMIRNRTCFASSKAGATLGRCACAVLISYRPPSNASTISENK